MGPLPVNGDTLGSVVITGSLLHIITLFVPSGQVLAGVHGAVKQAVSIFCDTARWQPASSEVALE